VLATRPSRAGRLQTGFIADHQRGCGQRRHAAALDPDLRRAKNPFAPVPHGIMCSMIDSGPQTASITGTWHGVRVASSYSRGDSCETARWNKLWKVFSQGNPGGRMIPVSGASPSN
jgi:hypothetical protein